MLAKVPLLICHQVMCCAKFVSEGYLYSGWADLAFPFTLSWLAVVLGWGYILKAACLIRFVNRNRKSLETCWMFWVTLRIQILVLSKLCQIKINGYVSLRFNWQMKRICWKILFHGAVKFRERAAFCVVQAARNNEHCYLWCPICEWMSWLLMNQSQTCPKLTSCLFELV